MDRTTLSHVVGRSIHQRITSNSKLKLSPTPGISDTMDQPGSSTPSDKSTRSSFSSVREIDSSDLAQNFTSSKVSSYSKLSEEAVDDLPSPPEMTTQTQFIPPITQPQSRLHGCWFPAVAAEGFQGWKQIGVKGRQASKSYGDLQALKIVWSDPVVPPQKKDPERSAPGQSAIEKLPTELLGESRVISPHNNHGRYLTG